MKKITTKQYLVDLVVDSLINHSQVPRINLESLQAVLINSLKKIIKLNNKWIVLKLRVYLARNGKNLSQRSCIVVI